MDELPLKQLEPSIAIITALPKEHAAVEILMENSEEFSVITNGLEVRYTLGFIPSLNGGAHRVVLAMLTSMGNNMAASRARHFA